MVDCSNQSEEDVRCSMRRLTIAFLDAGHEPKLIRQIMLKARHEVLFKIEEVSEEVLKWTKEQRKQYKEEYDAMRRRERNGVMEARKSDRC